MKDYIVGYKRMFFSIFLLVQLFCYQLLFSDSLDEKTKIIYNKLNLKKKISYDSFFYGYKGFSLLKQEKTVKKKNLLTIVDFSKPSTDKRLVVIDLGKEKLLQYELTAHGKHTGGNYAKHFSNMRNSLKSSLGFYVTGSTYYGKHGLSLKLIGVDRTYNNNAFKRLIVIHGAWYVSEDFAKKYNRLGRSWGCPALSKESNKEVINCIKNGSVLFIYANDEKYLNTSRWLNKKMDIKESSESTAIGMWIIAVITFGF
jgi:hypothetical protein